MVRPLPHRRDSAKATWPTVADAANETGTQIGIWNEWLAERQPCRALGRRPRSSEQFRPGSSGAGQRLRIVIDPKDVDAVKRWREEEIEKDLVLVADVPSEYDEISAGDLDQARRRGWVLRGKKLTVVRRRRRCGQNQIRRREHLVRAEVQEALANSAPLNEPIRTTHNGKTYVRVACGSGLYGLPVRRWIDRGECPFLPDRRLPDVKKLPVPPRFRSRVERGAKRDLRDLPIYFVLESDLVEAKAAKDKKKSTFVFQPHVDSSGTTIYPLTLAADITGTPRNQLIELRPRERQFLKLGDHLRGIVLVRIPTQRPNGHREIWGLKEPDVKRLAKHNGRSWPASTAAAIDQAATIEGPRLQKRRQHYSARDEKWTEQGRQLKVRGVKNLAASVRDWWNELTHSERNETGHPRQLPGGKNGTAVVRPVLRRAGLV